MIAMYDERDFDDDDEEYSDTRLIEAKVVSSSKVASLMADSPSGSEEARQFGKDFEENYQQFCYIYQDLFLNKKVKETDFRERFKVIMNDYSASRIAFSFFKADVYGLAPKTLFREVEKEKYISAKPDLLHQGKYIEFKLYALNDYAIAQSKVFSFVLNKSILLACWDGKNVKKINVKGSRADLPPIPDEYFSPTTILAERIIIGK